VQQGCWGPVVRQDVGKRGWIRGVGGCPNVGGIFFSKTLLTKTLKVKYVEEREITPSAAPSPARIIFGYRKEEALGQTLAALLPSEWAAELEEIRRKVEHAGVVRSLELRRRRKDGALIDVSVAVSPIRGAAERITGFLHSAKDITEKTRCEKRLKELDTMKPDFISDVSHELRTPLAAIKGSVDNMLDGITGPLNEKQVRYLARIKSSADRLARLIDNLLDLSGIESGKIDLRPEALPLLALSREVVESLRPIAVEKLISLEVIAPESAVAAWADRDKVIQVLVNLIGNALKFTPPEGRVSVTVNRGGEGWVKVSVADTGPGISLEEAGKIFDRFHRSAKTDEPKMVGSGLGLAISKALVELHGGQVWLDASDGQGSIFSFTLPQAPVPAPVGRRLRR
jgi:PAS domain S-box-containing protein